MSAPTTRRRSIRWKLVIAFLLVSLIPLAAFAAWNIVATYREDLAHADQGLLAGAREMVEDIERYLGERRLDAQRMSHAPVLLPFAREGHTLTPAERQRVANVFESHRRTYGYLRIALLRQGGEEIVAVGDPIAVQEPHIRRVVVEAWGGATAFSDPFFAGAEGPYILEVASPVRDEHGTPRGVILFALPFDAIAAMIRADTARLGLGTSSELVDERLIRIAHGLDPSTVGRPFVPLSPDLLEELTRTGLFGRRTAELLQAHSNQQAFATLVAGLREGRPISPLYDTVPVAPARPSRAAVAALRTKPWVYAVSVPYDVLLAPARAQALRSAIVLGLALVLATCSAWAVGGLARRRLRTLAGTAERLATGDFAARAEPGPADEIGRVAVTVNSMAEALETHRAATRSHVRRLETLIDVGRALTATLELPQVLSLVVERGQEIMAAPVAAIFHVDRTDGMLRIAEARGLSANYTPAVGEGVAGVAFREDRAMATEDILADAHFPLQEPSHRLMAAAGIRAAVAVPIRTPSEPYGVLAFYRHDATPFDAEQVRMATLLADQAGIAIENARLFQQEQERRRQLETVRALSEEITREVDLRTLLGLITRRAAELVGASSGAIWLWDRAQRVLVPKAWQGHGQQMKALRLKLGEGVAGTVAERRQGMIVNDYPASSFALPPLAEEMRVTAVVAEPLLLEDQLKGVITLRIEGGARRFREQDRELLALFAAEAALAIEKSRLFEQRFEQMVALSEALKKLVIMQPLETFLRDLIEVARQAVGARYGALSLVGRDGRFEHFIPVGITPEGEGRIGSPPVGKGLLGQMLQVPHPLRLDDLAKHPASHGFPSGHPPMRTFLGMRIALRDRVLGALYLTEKEEGGAFTAEDEHLVEAFAANAAVGIANARAFQEAEEARRALEAKTKELEAFTYTVSHDLKAPLRGIDGFSRALEEDYGDRLDQEAKHYLAMVRGAARRMDTLIEDLLRYSRLERRTLHTGCVDIAHLCRSIIEDRQHQIEARNLTLRLRLEAPEVEVEQEGLREAVANLVDNAVKFSKPGGTITITSRLVDRIPTEGGPAEGEPAGGSPPPPGEGGRYVVISVKDEGIGFDMRYHDRIFEIFQRLHRTEDFEGTGVGLAIVKKVAERHGGRAWAISAPGQGSTFSLALAAPSVTIYEPRSESGRTDLLEQP